MASAWIVKAVDVLKERRVHLTTGVPCVAPYQFSLHRLEEGFHHRIILAVSLAAHRDRKAVLA